MFQNAKSRMSFFAGLNAQKNGTTEKSPATLSKLTLPRMPEIKVEMPKIAKFPKITSMMKVTKLPKV